MSSGLYNTHKIDFDTTLDLTRLKPYGDTMNDGKVQTSFTLPIKDDERGEEAARQIAKKMGLEEPNVAYHAPLDKEFTFYVVYGSCVHSVNYEDIHVITVESDVMSMEDTNDYIREHIGRKVVMVGASTGTDAHTVGIDAIMNRKGFAGHYGLERYEMIEALALRSPMRTSSRRLWSCTPMFCWSPRPLRRRTFTSRTSPTSLSFWRPRACVTSLSSAAVVLVSPTSWLRSWAMTPASVPVSTPTTWLPSL